MGMADGSDRAELGANKEHLEAAGEEQLWLGVAINDGGDEPKPPASSPPGTTSTTTPTTSSTPSSTPSSASSSPLPSPRPSPTPPADSAFTDSLGFGHNVPPGQQAPPPTPVDSPLPELQPDLP